MTKEIVPPRETSGTSEASGELKPCPHQLWEREDECADGYCPICSKAQLASERERNNKLMEEFDEYKKLCLAERIRLQDVINTQETELWDLKPKARRKRQ